MRARYHFIITLLLSIPFLWYGDLWGALLCMITGFLIDVDHEVDHYIHYGRFTLNIQELSERTSSIDHYYCPLHSWELFLILYTLSYQYPPLFGGSIGLIVHLLLDSISNHMSPLSFFLIYRYVNNFRRVGVYGRYNTHEEQ